MYSLTTHVNYFCETDEFISSSISFIIYIVVCTSRKASKVQGAIYGLPSRVLALTHIDTNVGCSDLKYANITCHVDFDGVLCYFVYIVGIGILYRRSCTKAFKAQIYNRTFLQR
jgi:hypothetical protein